MVKIRLRRMGKKRQPFYKIIVADARSPRDGKYLEALGSYNPMVNPHTIILNEDRTLYWLKNGAQPTDTVKSILRQTGVTLKKELIKRGLTEEQVELEFAKWLSLKEASALKKKGQGKKAKSDTGTAEVKGATSAVSAAE